MARGSEELYRSMGFQPSYAPMGASDELSMADRQMDRDTDERRRRRADQTRFSERRDDRVSQIARDVPNAYMDAATWKANQQAASEESRRRGQEYEAGEQRYRMGEGDIKAQRQEYDVNALKKQEMERDKDMADKRAAYWSDTEEGGTMPRFISKEDMDYRDRKDEMGRQPKRRDTEEDQAEANLAATRKSTQLAGAELGLQYRQHDEAAQLRDFTEAANNPALLADVRTKWGKKADPTTLRVVEAQGARQAAANASAADIANEAQAAGTQVGQEAIRQVGTLQANYNSLSTAIDGAQEYQTAPYASGTSNAAMSKVVDNLRAMGKNAEADQIEKIAVVDTEGITLRAETMRKILSRLTAEQNQQLARAKTTVGMVRSRSIKAQLTDLEMKFSALERTAHARINAVQGGLRPVGGNNSGFLDGSGQTPPPAPPAPRYQKVGGAADPEARPAPRPGSVFDTKANGGAGGPAPGAAPSLRHRQIAPPTNQVTPQPPPPR